MPRVLSLLILAAFTGCAYYNTFYLAKRNFREAERAQSKSDLDVPSSEASAKYDAAIRQCTKLLSDYPKSKYVDDAMYVMGASLYGKGEYAASIKKLEELLAKFPQSPHAADARFTRGLDNLKLREYEVADTIFRAVDRDVPGFGRKWALYYYAGECQALQKHYGAALYWYRRAVVAAPAKRERADALHRSGDVLYTAASYDSARMAYGECLRSEERPKQRFDVALKHGESLREMKRYQEALAWFQDWRAFAVTEKREGELYLRIYECMGLSGRAREAIAGYGDLITRYPRTNIAYEAQFRIGYLYESQLGDLDAAGREYDKLRDGPPSQFQLQADRRAQGLQTLKQFRQEIASDTTQAKARAAFLLAELYYFQLEKVDSADAQYRLVEAQFPKSRYAPKAAYARLWILTQNRADTLGAAALADTIAWRYPGSRYVESSLYLWKRWSGRTDRRTELLDSLIAHPDTAAARERFEEERPPSELAPGASTSARADSLRAAEREAAIRSGARSDSLAAGRAAPSHTAPDSTRTSAPDSARARQEPPPGEPPRRTALPDTSGLPAVGPSR